jgi:hypothetical protein
MKISRKYLWKILYKECIFCPDPLTNMAATGNSCFWLADFFFHVQHAHKFFHLEVYPNFWGCNVPSNSSFRGTKKMNCIFLISHVQFGKELAFIHILQSRRKRGVWNSIRGNVTWRLLQEQDHHLNIVTLLKGLVCLPIFCIDSAATENGEQ